MDSNPSEDLQRAVGSGHVYLVDKVFEREFDAKDWETFYNIFLDKVSDGKPDMAKVFAAKFKKVTVLAEVEVRPKFDILWLHEILEHAVRQKYSSIIPVFLDNGANPRQPCRSENKINIYQYALQVGDRKGVDCFLKKDPTLAEYGAL